MLPATTAAAIAPLSVTAADPDNHQCILLERDPAMTTADLTDALEPAEVPVFAARKPTVYPPRTEHRRCQVGATGHITSRANVTKGTTRQGYATLLESPRR